MRAPSTEVDPQLVDAATDYLRSKRHEIPPRLQWPPGLTAQRGPVPDELRLQPGIALSSYNDGGWGDLVYRGKYTDERFSDELVKAAAQHIRERWQPEPFPGWVACIPSLTNPELVPNFARRLADSLGVPFDDILVKVRETKPQKEMENSSQQLQNVLGAFDVKGTPRHEPVLLVDDIVDSRWTMTVAGVRLREAGSGPVYPFALATAVSV